MQTQDNRPIIPIRSLAHFKKSIQVGVAVHVIYHREGKDTNGTTVIFDDDKGIREVTQKRTDRFALEVIGERGKSIDSWCDYPRASDYEIKEGKLLVYEQDPSGNKRRLDTTFALIKKESPAS